MPGLPPEQCRRRKDSGLKSLESFSGVANVQPRLTTMTLDQGTQMSRIQEPSCTSWKYAVVTAGQGRGSGIRSASERVPANTGAAGWEVTH